MQDPRSTPEMRQDNKTRGRRSGRGTGRRWRRGGSDKQDEDDGKGRRRRRKKMSVCCDYAGASGQGPIGHTRAFAAAPAAAVVAEASPSSARTNNIQHRHHRCDDCRPKSDTAQTRREKNLVFSSIFFKPISFFYLSLFSLLWWLFSKNFTSVSSPSISAEVGHQTNPIIMFRSPFNFHRWLDY